MACAEDTKGQTCYICTEAVHWKTKEGLVRMCACRGTAAVHVSCLAEQAKILVAEAEENNLDDAQRWSRWHSCGLCEQDYHGVVRCALGWACWKTYVGRPDMDDASDERDVTPLATVYTGQTTTRTRCPCKRPRCPCCGALLDQRMLFSSRRTILRARIRNLDGLPTPAACGKKFILDG